MSEISSATEQTEQRSPVIHGSVPVTVAPESGRRMAFLEIKRQLSDADFTNPGTQKLILDMLFTAESERDEYRAYISRFNEADKRASILEEKLRSSRVNEILFTVMVGVGGTIIGLAPSFWSNITQGSECLILGGLLVVIATIGRIAHK